MEQEKLTKYAKGEALSNAELAEILAWIEASEENRQAFEQLKSVWVLTGIADTPANPSLHFFELPTTNRKSFVLSPLVKYAAIFILAFSVGAGSLFVYNRVTEPQLAYNEIRVPVGEKSMISLYDGTRIWLNSGSSLKYPATFSKKERQVILDGEGYFEVAKDTKHPFIIRAHELDVKVLGTRFNVDAYADKEDIQVTLEEGSVVAKAHKTDSGITLKPGEQAIFDRKSRHLKQLEVDAQLFSSWKENLLRFEDAPLSEVIQKMEQWYGVQITLDRSIDTTDKFNLSIKTESLREMLNLISKTIPITYEINGDQIMISRL